ncbi:Uncharacterised protein [Brevundimonas diminuta]|jgi:hypothetical protein|uniref:hypothetical protein n=1 Tax=Brevundimonas diminuta TaxID=293 RepID=UPI000207EFC8|nr:hypothetical protein [Brevundimonas diminuta]EGF96349.1 hypothetical protein BDIM_01520 [Brevundimonas diminuta ATCC 11568]OWR18818.1 hypothetical protein CD944_10670 [Brevundimonas diminuta]WQE44343.1 hypothetical protein U0020_12225 [Brevundimonas diminuta]SPU43803.1 Uncharacterised protein [Brevundimonas diminuta]SUW16852.1 Uncharacterised protein [Brevundimonas diminuta]
MRPNRWLTAAAFITPLALTAALGACAPSVAPLNTTGAPLPVAGYDWFLNEDPDEPRLSYGLAQSDDVPLSLMCAPGSGKIGLSLAADQTPNRRAITLESGGDTETFPARVEAADMHDGVHLVATAPASHPVFLRFRRVGWLAVWNGDQRAMMAAQPGSEGRAARFLELCR